MDDPKLNAQIDKAKQITDPDEAAKAWGDLDKEVTEPGLLHHRGCGTTTSASSRANMNGVSSKFNSGACDFAFSSFK